MRIRGRQVIGVATIGLAVAACNGGSGLHAQSCGMYPAFEPGVSIHLDSDPERIRRFDVVVHRVPGAAAEGDLYVHRIVGLPGERIETVDGAVQVDGRTLEEPYVIDGTFTEISEPVDIPSGSYYVLGDNRPRSSDSRVFGPVETEVITGRVTNVADREPDADSECFVAPSGPPRPAKELISEADPPGARLLVLQAAIDEATPGDVTPDTLEAARTELAELVEQFAQTLPAAGSLDATLLDALTRLVDPLRRMTSATTIHEWNAARAEYQQLNSAAYDALVEPVRNRG